MARLSDIQIRDPFILRAEEEYWLYGTTDRDPWRAPGVGFDVWRSPDLAEWSGPHPAFRPPAGWWGTHNFWAPEVHAYDGRYFLFGTFIGAGRLRGTAILVADSPAGPFQPWSDGAVTPRHWQCLDATLHIDTEGDPWLVFCQEWKQIHDGAIWVQRLTMDLRSSTGRPTLAFNASEAPWTRPIRHGSAAGRDFDVFVTDGPFIRQVGERLVMLWSSFTDDGYALGAAISESVSPTSRWTHQAAPVWALDGGHAMVFDRPSGDAVVTFHQPNETPHERAVLMPIHFGDTVTAGPV